VNDLASPIIDFGVFFFEYLRVIVAFIAVVLAVTWKRNEFIAGLFFLFLWSFLDAFTVTLSTVTNEQFINASQFGFVLIALVCFILGMRPAKAIEKPSG
jgi:hypothetical protein